MKRFWKTTLSLFLLFGAMSCMQEAALIKDVCEVAQEINAAVDAYKKEGVKGLWEEVKANGVVRVAGADNMHRANFAGLQTCVESALASLLQKGKVAKVVGVIHTPLPPTPLRTEGKISPGLVHKAINLDPERRKTIELRPFILRSYLRSGGYLIAAYPKKALKKPIPGFLSYRKALKQFKGNLTEARLDLFKPEHTGATYVVTHKDGRKTVFSLLAHQAHSPFAHQIWSVWWGLDEHPVIQTRLDAVHEFLRPHGIDLMA